MEINKLRYEELNELKEIRDYCLEFLNDPKSFTLEETQEWF